MQTFLNPIIITICLLLGGTILFLFYVYRKERRIFTKEEDILSEYEKILLRAHNHAITILKKANKKAERLVAKGSFVQKEELESIKQKLQQQTITALELYKKELSLIEENLEKAGEQELHDFTSSLQNNITNAQQKIDKQVEEELTKAKNDVQSYKEKQMQAFDEEVKTLMKKLAVEVLGKSISLADHEALVDKALQQAKENDIFHV